MKRKDFLMNKARICFLARWTSCDRWLILQLYFFVFVLVATILLFTIVMPNKNHQLLYYNALIFNCFCIAISAALLISSFFEKSSINFEKINKNIVNIFSFFVLYGGIFLFPLETHLDLVVNILGLPTKICYPKDIQGAPTAVFGLYFLLMFLPSLLSFALSAIVFYATLGFVKSAAITVFGNRQ